MKEIDFKVYGMICPSCKILLTKTLKGIEGVKKVSVSLKDSKAHISYDEKTVCQRELIHAIESESFEVDKWKK
jgi:copper chaperone CopZ